MSKRFTLAAAIALLFLPLLVVAKVRGLLPLLMEFPLRTHYVDQPPFSTPVFTAFSALALVLAAVLIRPGWFGFKATGSSATQRGQWLFPWWGKFGMCLLALSWTWAWTRPASLSVINDYSFFPLWLGYILSADAFVFRRTGMSRLSASPVRFAGLFPASSLAWWYFEFVNRFVQNWWYVGVEHYSGLHYFALATISFSTVFPAVFVTHDGLATFQWFQAAYRNGPALPSPGRFGQWMFLVTGVAALAAVGWKPTVFFYFTWFAPLLILGSSLALADVESPLSGLRLGDYTELFTFAVAALACGWFWEMWNYFSMPKWYYSVPYVMRAKVFEMPAPGFGGYLPFGPICWCMWLCIRGIMTGRQEMTGH